MYVIDIHNIRCLEPSLPLYDHLENLRFLGLICKVDLPPRLICYIVGRVFYRLLKYSVTLNLNLIKPGTFWTFHHLGGGRSAP